MAINNQRTLLDFKINKFLLTFSSSFNKDFSKEKLEINSAEIPTNASKLTAKIFELNIPSLGINKNPANKTPDTAPRVFTPYNKPSLEPK